LPGSRARHDAVDDLVRGISVILRSHGAGLVSLGFMTMQREGCSPLTPHRDSRSRYELLRREKRCVSPRRSLQLQHNVRAQTPFSSVGFATGRLPFVEEEARARTDSPRTRITIGTPRTHSEGLPGKWKMFCHQSAPAKRGGNHSYALISQTLSKPTFRTCVCGSFFCRKPQGAGK